MSIVLVVAIAVVAVVIVAGLALNPVIAKKNDEAIRVCKDLIGPDNVKLIEPRAVGFASEPEEAGGPRGQGCLAVSADKIVFVTTAGAKQYEIDRSAIGSVDTEGDPRSDMKTTLIVNYHDPAHGEVKASWRLVEVPRWLDELGYDWGAEGPPPSATGLE